MKRGFSLVELLLTMVILAVSVYGSLTILGGMSRQSGDATRQTLVMEYARMRMEQILSKRFDELTGNPATCSGFSSSLRAESGETEANYDDADDFVTPPFDGEINDPDGAGPLIGDPLGGRGLRTNVFVEYVTPAESGSGNLVVSGMSCYKRATVQVVDVKTNQVLGTVRTLVTPYK